MSPTSDFAGFAAPFVPGGRERLHRDGYAGVGVKLAVAGFRREKAAREGALTGDGWEMSREGVVQGLPEQFPLQLDQRRLCVLLTRHRQACVVVGREGDAGLLEDRPPLAAEAYLG
jgi:hypothetical protein